MPFASSRSRSARREDSSIRVLERLRENLGLKLLSLAIAIGGWSYLRFAPNPVVSAKFVQDLSVPITISGLRSEEIVHYNEKQALVSIVVPRSGPAIRPDDVRAVLQLSERDPGVYNVPVELIAPKLEISSLAPASVTLQIERVEERSLPIVARYVGARRTVVDRVSFEPSLARLRAATSQFAQVQAVRVDVPLPSAPGTLDAMVRPIAIDARGYELPISVTPDLVRVRAKFGPEKK